MGDPAVVDLGAVLTQDHLLDPVGVGPARGLTRLDANAQGLGARAVVGHRLDEREEVGEGRGDLVAGVREGARLIPDERLHVGLDRHAVGGAVNDAELVPRVRPVVLRESEVGDRDHVASAGEVGELAGLREDRDVGRVATLDLRVDLRFPVGAAEVGHLDAVGLTPGSEDLLKGPSLLFRALGTGHQDLGLALGGRLIGRLLRGSRLISRCFCCVSVVIATASRGHERQTHEHRAETAHSCLLHVSPPMEIRGR